MHRHDVHVDPIEAQEVVRLAAERQSAVQDNGPTVNGLAEALGLPREEIERLLTEVRTGRGVASVEPRRRIFGDRSAALSAALALGLFMAAAGFATVLYGMRQAAPPAMVAAAAPPLMEPEVLAPPIFAPSAPLVPGPDRIIIDLGEQKKREEIERLSEEIARLQTERSKSDLDRTLSDMHRTLEELRKEKASAEG